MSRWWCFSLLWGQELLWFLSQPATGKQTKLQHWHFKQLDSRCDRWTRPVGAATFMVTTADTGNKYLGICWMGFSCLVSRHIMNDTRTRTNHPYFFPLHRMTHASFPRSASCQLAASTALARHHSHFVWAKKPRSVLVLTQKHLSKYEHAHLSIDIVSNI